jgi:signal transduction histidine kinase
VTGAVILFRDISERLAGERRERQQKLALDRAYAELEHKNREMESMIYTASHDLRSPLVNIQGFSQRLHKSIQAIDERLRQEDVGEPVRQSLQRLLNERIPGSLDFIRSSSLKMDSLINGLLLLSRAGRAQLNIQNLDMNAMLGEIVGGFTIQTQQAQGSIQVEPLPACRGDPGQINQVFSNLIDNAIKYRDPQRPLRIGVSGERHGDLVRYRVCDNGIGIAEDFQQQVWQLFHRLDPNGPVPGEGLGLTMVLRILQRQQGRIELQSSPGQGSCFSVELPAAGPDQESPQT